MSLYPLSVYLQMDLICRCMVYVSTMICACVCVCVKRLCCKSSIVVCMPLVFRVRVMMVGWVYVGGFWESRGDNGV
jgi:hypothetical protein